MPTYSYTCLNCGEQIDITKPMNQHNTEETCIKCNSKLTRNFRCNFKLCDSFYDNSQDQQDALQGKPYKGRYFKEDDDCNMGR